jgi:predicted amidohydrolase
VTGKLVAAAVQLNSGDDVGQNLRQADELVCRAVAGGAQLVVLPENFALMPASEKARIDQAEADGDGPMQTGAASIAQRHGCWLVAGSLPIRRAGERRPASACCVYDSDGKRVARYDKLHLFDVRLPGLDESYRESDNTAPGHAAVAVESPWGRLGLTICYDLRFPELYRQLAASQVDLFVVPAAFTRPTGQSHWSVLLRARAIENLSYVIAAAQCGEHPGERRTWGHSMIVGPWGEVLAEAAGEPGFILSGLDLARCGQLRDEFPTLAHSRYDIGNEPPVEIVDKQ